MADSLLNTLQGMNLSELVQVARVAGLGNLSRDLPKNVLVEAILEDEALPADALEVRRVAIERHIARYKNRLLSQLPGCTGKCTSYGCPDVIVTRCWLGFSRDML